MPRAISWPPPYFAFQAVGVWGLVVSVPPPRPPRARVPCVLIRQRLLPGSRFARLSNPVAGSGDHRQHERAAHPPPRRTRASLSLSLRYWTYSVGVPAIAQDIVTDVLEGYKQHALPLNHLVMDMDWHAQQCQYTWNTTIIPDPAGWIRRIHDASTSPTGNPLKYLLNLHPNGVHSNEAGYPQAAKIAGVTGNASIPCNLADPKMANAYFDAIVGAGANQEVDYWWTDYGGCGQPASDGSDGSAATTTSPPSFQIGELGTIGSLWWSNYIYHTDPRRFGTGAAAKRGLVLSRHGGLGTHRYS